MSGKIYPLKDLGVDDLKYYDLRAVAEDLDTLPFSIRILLESAVRNFDGFEVTEQDVQLLLNWRQSAAQGKEVAFKPARVILQDFTGVPCVVDLACMRDAMKSLGGDPELINPKCPTDLVIDHSVVVDESGFKGAIERNEEIEFQKNAERYRFLKWGQSAFKNMSVVPPGTGIVHQINIEYLSRVVFYPGCPPKTAGSASSTASTGVKIAYPDTVVGTDSHTTMVDGLGVLGWGVGGIEAEATMMGQPNYMVVPEIVGFKLVGEKLPSGCTATDLVLKIAQMLRAYKVVGKIVEFYGPGCQALTVADRSTISNMSPEFGCTAAFFPCDSKTMDYLRLTGRDEKHLEIVEKVLRAQGLFRDDDQPHRIEYSGEGLTLDLAKDVVPCVAGPKRPHDFCALSEVAGGWRNWLKAPVGFRGFGIPENKLDKKVAYDPAHPDLFLKHGSVVIAAITSCTNTSNPSVMLAAGLLAKKAMEHGLKAREYVKCSLSPGSHVVYEYLKDARLVEPLEFCGFYLTGFGCQTCIGNSGDLKEEVLKRMSRSSSVSSVSDDHETINDLVLVSVLSGNRNFEGRIHPSTRGNFLASPPLVVAYALAGKIDIDFESERIQDKAYLKDIWPSNEEIEAYMSKYVQPGLFKRVYENVTQGNAPWNNIPQEHSDDPLYPWSDSTYIHKPPFFDGLTKEPEKTLEPIEKAYCLLYLGDSITTDHISPAGRIQLDSPAAKYLTDKHVPPREFNSYGSRRGNDEVMIRGTFANVRLMNRLSSEPGPYTRHIPTDAIMSVYDAAMAYKRNRVPLIILAGAEYGSGSSRDWAAKGTLLLGVRAVIAKSFERIHRSNLVGMGILPLEFLEGQSPEGTLGLSGRERFSIDMNSITQPRSIVKVTVHRSATQVTKFETRSRIDTPIELEYLRHKGILPYVIRKAAAGQ